MESVDCGSSPESPETALLGSPDRSVPSTAEAAGIEKCSPSSHWYSQHVVSGDSLPNYLPNTEFSQP